ncbi:MAG TPA: Na/Pi cotransporter family protein [Phycisphaerales bacterium]|nr:Na/Pi cotransporter family protein [Phycisphaerales bacterium]
MNAQMVFEILGGFGLFLLGMKNMSEGMQAVAGERLRRMIGAVTNNRLMACGVGTAVTCLIQSSSITTVMVVGMVNAGVMTLLQAIGVIAGANIGTTITGWVVTLSVDKYGLPLIGSAALIYLFIKRDRVRFTAMFVLGLGMVFYGLQLMKTGFSPFKDMPGFVELFHRFEPTSYFGVLRCCMIGALLTALIQSSSATLAITMTLAFSGAITYQTAAALVLGENIGTTITAFLASLGTSPNARRAAYAHIMFNVFGVLWITAIFSWYTDGVLWFLDVFHHTERPDVAVYTDAGVTYPHVMAAIAVTHSAFNIVNTILFLPLIGYVARFLNWAVPDRKKPTAPRLTYLDVRVFDTPSIALEQSGKEVVKMGHRVDQMLELLREVFAAGNLEPDKIEPIFQAENDLDIVQKEIVEFIGHIMSGNISHETMKTAREQLRMSDEFESISDYVVTILKLRLKMRDTDQVLSPEALEEILQLHDMVSGYICDVNHAVESENGQFLKEAMTRGTEITTLMKDCRSKHLARVGDGKATPLKSLIYTDMLTSYRRIKDHAFNIAEVLAGEK